MLEVKANRVLRLINEIQYLLLEILIKPLLDKVFKRKTHTIIVVDASGSMSGEKLRKAKNAIKKVIHNLRPEDTVSIIAFNTTATILSQRLTIEHIPEIESKLNALTADGGTEINQGLNQALDLIACEELATIILLSDGASDTPNEDYKAAERAKLQQITIYCAGIEAIELEGQKILTRIAQLSGGFAEWTENTEGLMPFLEHCFQSIQSSTWEHVTLNIQTVGGCKIVDLAKYAPEINPQKLPNPTNAHQVAIGNVTAEEPNIFIAKIEISKKSQPGTYLIAKITVKYNIGTIQKTTDLEVSASFSENAPVPPLNEIDKMYLAIEAKRAEQRGDLQTTKRLYETIRDNKLVDIAGKMASGTATQTERVQFEFMSTRRERHN